MVGQELNQASSPNIRRHIQLRFQHDSMPGKAPLPHQGAIIGHPVATHGDDLL